MTSPSIARRLFVGLTIVGLTGALLLLIFIVREHQQAFGALQDPVEAHHAFQELTQHVLVPIIVLIIPMGFASLFVIRRALRPLEAAADRLRSTPMQERGVAIDPRDFPGETLPFVEAVNSLLSRLDRAARDHEAFAADVAHELRTPLTVLALELDALDDPVAPRLKADVQAMRRLIDQLMLLARVEAESLAHSMRETIRLEDVGADVVGWLAPAAIAEGKTLALLVEGAPSPVTGQRETITAALRNLVENALRVTPPGDGITVLVGPGARVRVRDGGAGLSPDHLTRLVQRHQRADHASEKGAGLGLSIVARIMSAHGGALRTEPESRTLLLDFSQGD